jgi:hypothetical protein
LFAQEAGNWVYLFDSFKPATVIMKNGSKASASFNYDGSKREMVYYDKEQTDGAGRVGAGRYYLYRKPEICPFQQKFREFVR